MELKIKKQYEDIVIGIPRLIKPKLGKLLNQSELSILMKKKPEWVAIKKINQDDILNTIKSSGNKSEGLN